MVGWGTGWGHSFPQKTQLSLIHISVSDGKHIKLKHILKETIQ